ncbi:MAG: hypothetical protein ACTHMS_10345 [Jatrophihabitans sp.]|uniref:hypothetical protein n=1 Tax=Jatrophihabitans sp. TaxID=1932789 RepID=UPI003F7F2A4E
MTGRTTWARTLSRAVAALVLAGLFAMHGLPDAMATASSGMAAAGTLELGQREASPTDQRAEDRQVSDMSADMHGRQQRDAPVALSSALRGAPASMPGGCGLDHAGCVAVLRDAPRTDAPAVVAADAYIVAGSARTDPRHSVVCCRAPPDVSLVELGISRT